MMSSADYIRNLAHEAAKAAIDAAQDPVHAAPHLERAIHQLEMALAQARRITTVAPLACALGLLDADAPGAQDMGANC